MNDSVLSQLRETAAPAYSVTDYKKRVKQEKERLQKEKDENARLEKERLEREKFERLMIEKAKAEKARFENEKLEKDRLEREKYEKARMERHLLSKAKAEGAFGQGADPDDVGFKDVRSEIAKREAATPGFISIAADAVPAPRSATFALPVPAPSPQPIAPRTFGTAASFTSIPQLSDTPEPTDEPSDELADEELDAPLAPMPVAVAAPPVASVHVAPPTAEPDELEDESPITEPSPAPVTRLFSSYQPVPSTSMSSEDEDDEARDAEDAEDTKIDPRRKKYLIVAALVLVCLGATYLLGRSGLFHFSLLGRNDRLMVATIENRTDDKTLDGAVAQALEFELQDSPRILLRGGDAYRSTTRQLMGSANRPATTPVVLARQAAQAAGAKAYLYGTLRPAGAGYLLTVEILNASSNRRIVEVQESAASRDQIVTAVDRAATRLRIAFGERIDAAHGTQVHEATANLEALHQYSLGEAAALDGSTDEAVTAFQSAVKLDPKFVQAQMQLAWLYRLEHAETASAAAAQLAQQAAVGASERTQLLANFAYEFNTTGNMDRAESAIRRFIALYPHDAQGTLGLTRLLRAEGRLGDAVDAAKHGLDDDPYNANLYAQAELALIGLDRYGDALALEKKSQQNALAHDGIVLTAAYLAGQKDTLDSAIEQVELPQRNATSMAEYGVYLDETGQIAAGTTLWKVTASGREPVGVDPNNRSWLLAQAALDRALVGDCDAALGMARTAMDFAQGITANFNAGVAAALCGNSGLAQLAIVTLDHDWLQNAEVRGHRLPDLRAAVALGRHNYQAALDALKTAQPNDPTVLSVYLRGLAYVGLHQTQLGIADFQVVLAHHGIALTGGSDVYPAAQIALARAYAQSGDKNDSAQEYKKFLDTWRGADTSERLQVEALNATGR
jgi:serine/threonine-protein kinase